MLWMDYDCMNFFVCFFCVCGWPHLVIALSCGYVIIWDYFKRSETTVTRRSAQPGTEASGLKIHLPLNLWLWIRPETSGLLSTVSKIPKMQSLRPFIHSYSVFLLLMFIKSEKHRKSTFPTKFLEYPSVIMDYAYSLPVYVQGIYEVGGNWEWWARAKEGLTYINIYSQSCFVLLSPLMFTLHKIISSHTVNYTL